MNFNCRLKVIFAEKNIQQTEFAHKIGMSRAALSLLVNNKTLPSFKIAYKIAKELNLHIEEIWIEEV